MKNILIAIFLLFVFVPPAYPAFDVMLEWNANVERDLAGYKLYYSIDGTGEPYEGVGLDQGDSPIEIPLDSQDFDPNNPKFTLTGLDEYETYWIVVTAYDNEEPSLESYYSNEIQAFICHAHEDDPGCFIGIIQNNK